MGAYVNAKFGITYRGEVQNGTMNGTGTMTGPNGHKYEGEWKDGQPNSPGALTFLNGSRVE